MTKDLVLGILSLLFSAFYLWQAAQIPTSALGDAVGAGGVPLILDWAMAAAGTLLIVHNLWLRRTGKVVTTPVSIVFDDPRRLITMAGGVVFITVIYLTILRPVGYIPATALFLAALFVYQRVPFTAGAILTPIGGAFVLWLLFDALLGINLPGGFLAGLL